MNPFLWLLWALLALTLLFIAAAIIIVTIEKIRQLPPKQQPIEQHIQYYSPTQPQRTYGEAIDHTKRHGRQQ